VNGKLVSGNWHNGNAEDDGRPPRLDSRPLHRPCRRRPIKQRRRNQLGIHPIGDKRTEWTADDQRTTLVFRVKGKFRIDLTEGSFTLEREGDYLVWGPGIDHSWEALTEAVVVTVRWPSSLS
jgi:hypothetical protein